jgi:SAM-dependent methyltransferase
MTDRRPPAERMIARVRMPGRRDSVARDLPISAELQAEVDGDPWMYEWRLTSSVVTPVIGDNLPSVHRTREEMIAPVVRRSLAAAGPAPRALDLGCNEGMFSHKLLEWGAASVVGIDSRASNIRRASLLRDHFDISAERLRFVQDDVLDLTPEAHRDFDVVLCLGLIYHMERPLEVLRVARRLTRSLCVIESQLTRQAAPIVRGDGIPGAYTESPASFAAWVEADSVDNRLSSMSGVMSLVPNLAALEQMPLWAGFKRIDLLAAAPDHDPQYVGSDRAIVAAWTTGPPER